MKLFSSIFLAFSLSADAFVLQPSSPSYSTTSLKDVGLQWGFDENGCRTEYYLEHWSERNEEMLQSKWAYDPWSGVSQTIFIPSHNELTMGGMQQAYAEARMNVQAVKQQQVAALPPAVPAQPMPDVQVSSPQYSYLSQLEQMRN